MKVSDIDYVLEFQPEVTSVAALARKFCVEQGGRLGVTADTLDSCILPVANYLQMQVDKDAQATTSITPSDTARPATQEVKPVVAKFRIEGLDYQVSFYPTLVSTQQVAIEFCRQKGGEFGITESNFPACVTAVQQHVDKTINTAPVASAAANNEKSFRTVTVG